MGIGVITIFCNESFRIEKWKKYLSEYENEFTKHIIVDNNSLDSEYEMLKNSFPNTEIIRLTKNLGVTGAYNVGIATLLKNESIDSIAFIGNDIKLERGGLTKLREFLFSNDSFGEVAPVLLKKDSNIIEDNGDWFSYNLVMNEFDLGKRLDQTIESHVCDGLPGAMNIAKCKMYKEIGLLDEMLFMYSDEVDIGIRAKQHGYIFSSCVDVKAWHQHEFQPKKKARLPFSNYLVIRNKVYLAGKYYGFFRKLFVFASLLLLSTKEIVIGIIKKNKDLRKAGRWQIIGAINGLVNNMEHNKFSNPGGV